MPVNVVSLKKHCEFELSAVIACDGTTTFDMLKLKVRRAELVFDDEEIYVRGLFVNLMPNGSLVELTVRFAGTPSAGVEADESVA